jgi:DNA-binding protein HU-beta
MATSTEIADKIAAEHNLTRAQAKAVLEGIFQVIAQAAAADEEVSVPGFGKFKLKSSPERKGRNPSTGETIQIAASRKVTFTPAKALKDAVNK